MRQGNQAAPPARQLQRRRTVDRAWQLFVDDGVEPTGLRNEISRSWRRARESYRIDPRIALPPRLLTTDALVERRERDEVLRVAMPVLEEFANRLSATEHVLAYFDGDGWMLSIDGAPGVIESVAEVNFRPGANWAEESAGTNGIGTALLERKPVEVFASEHFVAAFQRWTCSGAPVLGATARPVGIVDITGPWEGERPMLVVARAIARAIKERLHAATLTRDEVVKHAFRLAREAGDALVAIDANGRVLAANDTAVRRHLLDEGALRGEVRDALDHALRMSANDLDGEVCLQSPDGSRIVTSLVRYEGSTVGAVVRAPAAGRRGQCLRPHAPNAPPRSPRGATPRRADRAVRRVPKPR